MADEKIKVNKITTEGGQVFYTKEQDRSQLWKLPGVKRIEDTQMTEDEYNAIPATQESKDFFAGVVKTARSE